MAQSQTDDDKNLADKVEEIYNELKTIAGTVTAHSNAGAGAIVPPDMLDTLVTTYKKLVSIAPQVSTKIITEKLARMMLKHIGYESDVSYTTREWALEMVKLYDNSDGTKPELEKQSDDLLFTVFYNIARTAYNKQDGDISIELRELLKIYQQLVQRNFIFEETLIETNILKAMAKASGVECEGFDKAQILGALAEQQQQENSTISVIQNDDTFEMLL